MTLVDALLQLSDRPALVQRLPAIARNSGAVLIGDELIFATPESAERFRQQLTAASTAAKVHPCN